MQHALCRIHWIAYITFLKLNESLMDKISEKVGVSREISATHDGV